MKKIKSVKAWMVVRRGKIMVTSGRESEEKCRVLKSVGFRVVPVRITPITKKKEARRG